jgi:hypothetical protein
MAAIIFVIAAAFSARNAASSGFAASAVAAPTKATATNAAVGRKRASGERNIVPP